MANYFPSFIHINKFLFWKSDFSFSISDIEIINTKYMLVLIFYKQKWMFNTLFLKHKVYNTDILILNFEENHEILINWSTISPLPPYFPDVSLNQMSRTSNQLLKLCIFHLKNFLIIIFILMIIFTLYTIQCWVCFLRISKLCLTDKSNPPPVFINKILLEHSHIHSFAC